MAGTTAAEPQSAEVVEVLGRALERAGEPLTVNKLRGQLSGPYRLSADNLAEIMEQQVAAGRFFRFSPYMSKSPRYWHQDHATYARQEIQRALSKSAVSLGVLQTKLAKRLADCSPAQRKLILEDLVQAGAVHALPPVPGSKTPRYSASPPDPADYIHSHVNSLVRKVAQQAERLAGSGVELRSTWQACRQLLAAKLREVGVELGAAQSCESAGDAATADQHLSAAAVLEDLEAFWRQREVAGPVSLRELRQRCWPDAVHKQAVDRVLLELARGGRLTLFRHDYPASLAEAERQLLVQDSGGNFYNALALHDEAGDGK